MKTIIESINWIGCGGYRNIHTMVILVLVQSYIRSDIKIQKCSFQHSVAPAISTVLRKYWGIYITINHCSFMNNNHYRGCGAVIYYSYSSGNAITVNNCIFSYNGGVSLIYIIYENTTPVYTSITLVFTKTKVHLYYSIENNVADNGAGIYITDHSTITFGENSIVKFNNNKAINGVIYSKASSNVTFKANCEVTFSNNSATQYGAAIYSADNSHVTFTGNSVVNLLTMMYL